MRVIAYIIVSLITIYFIILTHIDFLNDVGMKRYNGIVQIEDALIGAALLSIVYLFFAVAIIKLIHLSKEM